MSDRPKIGEAFYACEAGGRGIEEDAARQAFMRAAEHHRVVFGPMRAYEDARVSGYEAEVVEVLP